jgi:hypothetical protein
VAPALLSDSLDRVPPQGLVAPGLSVRLATDATLSRLTLCALPLLVWKVETFT